MNLRFLVLCAGEIFLVPGGFPDPPSALGRWSGPRPLAVHNQWGGAPNAKKEQKKHLSCWELASIEIPTPSLPFGHLPSRLRCSSHPHPRGPPGRARGQLSLRSPWGQKLRAENSSLRSPTREWEEARPQRGCTGNIALCKDDFQQKENFHLTFANWGLWKTRKGGDAAFALFIEDKRGS